MKTLIGTLVLSFAFSAAAAESSIKGAWNLDEWQVINPAGERREFCKGAEGILIYEESGYVSTSINCPKRTTAQKEPADDYQRVFFYAGTYTERGGTIYKDVKNATFQALIGKSVPRKIERVTEHELILSGPFGKNSLWIRWVR